MYKSDDNDKYQTMSEENDNELAPDSSIIQDDTNVAASQSTFVHQPQFANIYLPIDLNYPNLLILNQFPPVLGIENFLSGAECDRLIYESDSAMSPSPVVGAGNGEISAQRTSSTCYFAREDLPSIICKVCALTNKPFQHMELPQVGRYYENQQYLEHFDAFDVSTDDGKRFAMNGGQRICTVLIYLNDVRLGGETVFPKLNLSIQPRRGNAIVFFPANINGELDPMALHCARPAVRGYTKWVSQIWIRQGNYDGIPSKRVIPPI
mmetsp:Transcript_11798/g.15405  ORF Transcript_11798/g.15405 Transcript_11798/m.15405 type:complete len:265 (+) Transcript_11798:234-1028(+)